MSSLPVATDEMTRPFRLPIAIITLSDYGISQVQCVHRYTIATRALIYFRNRPGRNAVAARSSPWSNERVTRCDVEGVSRSKRQICSSDNGRRLRTMRCIRESRGRKQQQEQSGHLTTRAKGASEREQPVRVGGRERGRQTEVGGESEWASARAQARDRDRRWRGRGPAAALSSNLFVVPCTSRLRDRECVFFPVYANHARYVRVLWFDLSSVCLSAQPMFSLSPSRRSSSLCDFSKLPRAFTCHGVVCIRVSWTCVVNVWRKRRWTRRSEKEIEGPSVKKRAEECVSTRLAVSFLSDSRKTPEVCVISCATCWCQGRGASSRPGFRTSHVRHTRAKMKLEYPCRVEGWLNVCGEYIQCLHARKWMTEKEWERRLARNRRPDEFACITTRRRSLTPVEDW